MHVRNFSVLVALLAGAVIGTMDRQVSAAGDPHAYFKDLVARRDVFKAYSLRPVPGAPVGSPDYGNQLERPRVLGYAEGNLEQLWITYDRGSDNDSNAQDGAKVTIPAFTPSYNKSLGSLAQPVSATADNVTLVDAYFALYTTSGRSVMLDSEIMDIYDPDGVGPIKAYDRDTGVLQVRRGLYGTVPASHAAGTRARVSTNNVPSTVRLPLDTSDGHTYFFTWEGYWTDSYLNIGIGNHKAFNFISNGIWLEPDTVFSGGRVAEFSPGAHVAVYQTRSYNKLKGPELWSDSTENFAGPGVSGVEPLSPQLATFIMHPNRWVRFFYRIEQRANDYDYVDSWIADEATDPIQIHRKLPVSVRGGTIEEFVLEFNSSTDRYRRGSLKELVSYVRNFVALQDPSDVASLLQRPVADGNIGPAPPTNIRLLR